ncbi:hypothetical protein BH09BAC1_BH09BAC1_08870 [soil metagenome]
MGLKLYGLIAIKLHSPLSLEDVAASLNIAFEYDKPTMDFYSALGGNENLIGCNSDVLL